MKERVFFLRTSEIHCCILLTTHSPTAYLLRAQWFNQRGLQTAHGVSTCHVEDTPDFRVGVALALRRVLAHMPEVTHGQRRLLRRAFYQAWPEAHPEYRVKKGWDFAAKAGDMVTRLTVVRGEGGPTGEVIRVTKVEQVPYEPPKEPSMFCRNCECALEGTHLYCHQCGVKRRARS